MRKHLSILPLLVALCIGFFAEAQQDTLKSNQQRPLPPSVRPIRPIEDYGKLMDTVRKWEFHLSMGTSLVGSRYDMATLSGVTPTVIYRPNNKLKIKGSVSGAYSYTLAPQGYGIRGHQPRSLAPYRYPATAMAATVSAEYQVNDRLWVGASVSKIGGELASGMLVNPWLLTDGYPVALDVTSFTAAMRYRFGDDNFLDIHLTVLNDRAGTLVPLLYDYPYGWGGYGLREYNPFGGHLFDY